MLGRLLRDAGYEQIGQRAHVIEFSYGTEGHEPMYQNCKIAFQLVQPFIVKMGVLSEARSARTLQPDADRDHVGRFLRRLVIYDRVGTKTRSKSLDMDTSERLPPTAEG